MTSIISSAQEQGELHGVLVVDVLKLFAQRATRPDELFADEYDQIVGAEPCLFGGRAGNNIVDKGRGLVDDIRHEHDPQGVQRDGAGRLPGRGVGLAGDELSAQDLVDRNAELGDGDRVVEPGVVGGVAYLFAEHGQQFAAPRDQGAPGCTGIAGDDVQNVDGPIEGDLENAAARVQSGSRGDRAPLHARRLVAHRHSEQVAESQHARAGLRGGGLQKVEIGQIPGVDLQQGDFNPRIGAQKLGLEVLAVGEHRGHGIGVEHVAPSGENVALAGDEQTALIRLEAAQPAGAEDLDDLGLYRGDDRGKVVLRWLGGGRGMKRSRCEQREDPSQGDRHGGAARGGREATRIERGSLPCAGRKVQRSPGTEPSAQRVPCPQSARRCLK